MSVFVVTYRWMDIASEPVTELFPILEEAEKYVEQLRLDEQGRKTHDPKSIGQLEITIDQYEYHTQNLRIEV